ncbi:hypothetical protein JCM3766R1_000804 [Sporobolomyces carnicolor]
MGLHARKSYAALDDDGDLLGGPHPTTEILDRQEQRHQVDQLVQLATESLNTHRVAISIVQAILVSFLTIARALDPLNFSLAFVSISLSIVVASIVQSHVTLSSSSSPTRVDFNLLLSIPLAVVTVFATAWSNRHGDSAAAIATHCAPLGVVLLRAASEYYGTRAIKEASALEHLMYDAPEA